jgi:hypothetical protein
VRARQTAKRTWPLGRPAVAGNMGVTQGMHVRPVPVDPCVCLISSTDGPVAGDGDIDVARRHVEQPQGGEVVLNRISRVVQVEQRNQDIRKHVAGDENPAFLNQQRRMARGMRLMLDNPDLRAIPRNLRRLGRQPGNEAEQVQQYLLGDVRRYQLGGDAGLHTRVRQPPISDIGVDRACRGRPGFVHFLGDLPSVHWLVWRPPSIHASVAIGSSIVKQGCGMILRIAIWAGVGLLVAVGWALYAYSTFPSLMQEDPLVYNLALLTQPIALASFRFHFGIGLYWVLLANALTYGFIGLIVETVRQKLHHA